MVCIVSDKSANIKNMSYLFLVLCSENQKADAISNLYLTRVKQSNFIVLIWVKFAYYVSQYIIGSKNCFMSVQQMLRRCCRLHTGLQHDTISIGVYSVYFEFICSACLRTEGKSFINIINMRGSRLDPCGTLEFTCYLLETFLLYSYKLFIF